MGAALGRIAKLNNSVGIGKQSRPYPPEVYVIATIDGHENKLGGETGESCGGAALGRTVMQIKSDVTSRSCYVLTQSNLERLPLQDGKSSLGTSASCEGEPYSQEANIQEVVMAKRLLLNPKLPITRQSPTMAN